MRILLALYYPGLASETDRSEFAPIDCTESH